MSRAIGTPRRARGFTLVEMLVVIGIIVFLAGLTMTVMAAVSERGARLQTQSTLQLLDTAMLEWETTAGRRLTWWDVHDDPALKPLRDVHGDTAEILILTEMLEIIRRVPSARQVLAGIDPDFIYTYEAGTYPPWLMGDQAGPYQMDERFDGAITVLDGWGWPIYATHPGREWGTASDQENEVPRDDDGTIMTYNEMSYGVTRNQRVCFVSAGPDRQFGMVYAQAGTKEQDWSADNLYSYPIAAAP